MKEILNLTENVHQREKWTVKLNSKAQEELSQENYQDYQDYSNEMIRLSLSVVSRHKNLTHFVKLSRLYGGEWKSITEHDVSFRDIFVPNFCRKKSIWVGIIMISFI